MAIGNIYKYLIMMLFVTCLSVFMAACGDGSEDVTSDYEDDYESDESDSVATIYGTLKTASGAGLANVEIGALGDSAITDGQGEFTLFIDGFIFNGGAVLFTLAGSGVDTTIVLDDVAGGPGEIAYVDFVLEDNGDLSAVSSDSDGNVLSEVTPVGALGCTTIGSFVDGVEGALWKPAAESSGTVVVLMPEEYQYADIDMVNSNGDVVDVPARRTCCSNGDRAHAYFSRTARDLAGAGVPLTVRFRFSDGYVDCRQVMDPTQRYD